MEENPAARAALLETVANQIKGDETHQVRAEYRRLLTEGYTDKEARETIGYVLGCHLVKTLKNQAPFDYAGYVADLKRLPDCDLDEPFA
jgi:hypothetical protein